MREFKNLPINYLSSQSRDELPITYNNVNDLVNDEKEYILKSLSNNIEKFNSSLKSDKISFVLGAGSSFDSGLKSWGDLIKFLLSHKETYHIEEEIYEQISNDLKIDLSFDSLQLVELIFDKFCKKRRKLKCKETRLEFNNLVKQGLYGNDYKNFEPTKNSFFEIYKDLFSSNKIKNTFTYNFDNLLEKEHNVEIEHLHGVLDFKSVNDNDIVLDETSSYNVDLKSPKYKNYKNSLIKDFVIFYGISFLDPNLRRQLISLKSEDNKWFTINTIDKNNITPKTIFNHDYIESLGVKIVYIDNYDLNNLKNVFLIN